MSPWPVALLGCAPQPGIPPAVGPAPTCDAVGFADVPEPWALPPTRHESGWWGRSGAEGEYHEEEEAWLGFAWDVVDLTGDGRLDLVVVEDDFAGEGVGVTHWDVYVGGDEGFAGTPIRWALPEPRDSDGWSDLSFSGLSAVCSTGGLAQLTWVVGDVTGDDQPDLAVQSDGCHDPEIGATRWDVFVGEEAGFAPEPVAWSLPTSPDGGWDPRSPVATIACASGETGVWRWSVADLFGNPGSDLVVFLDECEGVGLTHWEVYRSLDDGFAAEPEAWSLPRPRHEETWAAPAANVRTQCDGVDADLGWTTSDLTGDGLPDLVVHTDTCENAGVGTSHWDVYVGEMGGFATTPTAWRLPTSRGSHVWDALNGESRASCSDAEGDFTWATVDLTRDGVADLVVTADECDEDTLGQTHWDVYPGGPHGFADAALDWALPDLPHASRWDATSGSVAVCGGSRPDLVWEVFDLGGDGVPELVLLGDTCGDVGVTRWDVYEVVCG
jgi:hypothetical protein